MSARLPSRKQARRDALFVLYQREVTPLGLEQLFENLRVAEGYPADEFTVRCVHGVVERLPRLDARLEAHSRNWPLARVAPLERTILRLGLFEIESGETPRAVAIDEAVRLAKRYSTGEAGAFVNGVLAGASGQLGEDDG